MLLHAAICVFLIFNLSLWIDEVYTLETTKQGVWYAILEAIKTEKQAPVYFALLSLWREINSSIWSARLFSLICTVLTLPLIAALAHRYLPKVNSNLVVIVAALHPFLIWAGMEARLYGMQILLSALLLWLFDDAYFADQPQRRAQWLFLITGLLALYTQYYSGLLLASLAVVLLLLKKWKPLIHYLIGMFILLVAFLPMLRIALAQRQEMTRAVAPVISLTEAMQYLYWRVLEFQLPLPWESLPNGLRIILLIGSLAVLLTLFAATKLSLDQRKFTLLIATLVSSAGFVALVLLAGKAMVERRHTAILFVPATLAGFALVSAIRWKHTPLVWTLMICLLSAAWLGVKYQPLAQWGDYDRAARFLMEREQPGQPILVFRSDSVTALRYYYRGKNELVPVPYENKNYNLENFVLHNEAQLQTVIDRFGNPPELWFYWDENCEYLGVMFNCESLDQYLKKRYEFVEEKRLLHGWVFRLKRKDSGFSLPVHKG